MSTPAEISIFSAIISVALAGAVGYGIYWLAIPSQKTSSPLNCGRRWFAWVAILVSFSTLSPFFRHFDANSIAIWLINLAFYGTLALAGGWLYGKFIISGGASNQDMPEPKEIPSKSLRGTCPHCGGPTDNNVCWSCGTRG